MAKKKLNQQTPPPLTLEQALTGYFQKCDEYRRCIANGGLWGKLAPINAEIARFRKAARDQHQKSIKPRTLPEDWRPDDVPEFVQKYAENYAAKESV